MFCVALIVLTELTCAVTDFPVEWSVGDGIGGSEENIGQVTNTAECLTKCYSRKRNGKLANGVTVDAKTGKSCFCEYGQKNRNKALNWRNTLIRPCKCYKQFLILVDNHSDNNTSKIASCKYVVKHYYCMEKSAFCLVYIHKCDLTKISFL